MKKVIPSLIIIIICILLALTGSMPLSDFNDSQPAPEINLSPLPDAIYFNDPDAINLVELQFYGDYLDNPDWKEIWPKVIEDHYGVKINIVYPPRYKYMDTLISAAASGKLTGIVELIGEPYLVEWKEKELIYPLTDFLASNDVWNALIPDYWKEAFTIDDEVWAIPTGGDGQISWWFRYMRGDWLDKFGLNKPYTIDEFYQASHNFTYGDPDGNGKNDTIGFTSSGTYNLLDIFSAYDARLDHVGRTALAWNPNENVWEDSLIKPEMIECLNFLNKCYSERILDPDTFNGLTSAQMREKMSSGLYGGTSYWDVWLLSFENSIKDIFPDAYLLCIGGLTHTIDRNLTPYSPGSYGSPRVMMKNTAQPEETINWFVNTFYGDEWGFWTGRLGPVGEYPGQDERACTIEDKIIVRNTYIDQEGTIKTYPGPGYIGGLPSRALFSVYEVAYYVPSPPKGFESWAEDTASQAQSNMKRLQSLPEEYIENGMLYMLPYNLQKPSSDEYMEAESALVQATFDAIKRASTGVVTINDAISQYRTIAKSLGVRRILELENNKIGKTTDQDY